MESHARLQRTEKFSKFEDSTRHTCQQQQEVSGAIGNGIAGGCSRILEPVGLIHNDHLQSQHPQAIWAPRSIISKLNHWPKALLASYL